MVVSQYIIIYKQKQKSESRPFSFFAALMCFRAQWSGGNNEVGGLRLAYKDSHERNSNRNFALKKRAAHVNTTTAITPVNWVVATATSPRGSSTLQISGTYLQCNYLLRNYNFKSFFYGIINGNCFVILCDKRIVYL